MMKINGNTLKVAIKKYEQLKADLARCTEDQQTTFKRMYSYHDITSIGNHEKADLERPINEVVDKLPIENLEWACQQITRTININNAKGA